MITLPAAEREIAGVDSGTASAEFACLFDRIGSAALDRGAGGEHVTASTVIFDPAAEAVLLNHHRKAGLWGQFGGHLEPEDLSLRGAARREAVEESGLDRFDRFSSAPVELHVHDLEGAFGACTRHYDVVFAATARFGTRPRASAESFAVEWFRLDELPEDLMPDLVDRLPRLCSAEHFSPAGRTARRR